MAAATAPLRVIYPRAVCGYIDGLRNMPAGSTPPASSGCSPTSWEC